MLGWIAKALIVRDRTVLHVMSIAFELIEYLFEYQLPNFGECWWDHVRCALGSDGRPR